MTCESRQRESVADETGQWHASDELGDDVLAVKNGADPWAVSLASWIS